MTVRVPTRLRPYIKILLETGLFGDTEEKTVIQLVEMAIRREVFERGSVRPRTKDGRILTWPL